MYSNETQLSLCGGLPSARVIPRYYGIGNRIIVSITLLLIVPKIKNPIARGNS